MIKFFRNHKLLIILILTAAFLRLYKIPAYMEFLGDQGRDVLHVRRFIKEGDLMFIGPQTSIGNMYLGPWYYYLIAPSLLLANFSPLGPAVFNALFGVLTVWLIWEMAKRWFNRQTAFLSGLFLAFSPVMIKYSTFSWNPNVLPFFSLLSIWFLWRIFKKDDYQSLIWLAVSLAMVLNSHYLGLLLFPITGLVILLKLIKLRKREEKQQLADFLKIGVLSIGIFLLFMSPLFIFDLKHDFANYKAFRKFFTVRQTTVNLKFYKGFTDLPKLFNQLTAQFICNKDSCQYTLLILPLFILPFLVKKKKFEFWLVIGWLLFGLIGLGNYKQHVYAHYFLFLYPAVALLLAVGLKKLKILGLIIGLTLTGIMFTQWHGWNQPVYQLRRAKKVAQFIEEKSNNQEFALGLIAEQNYDDPYRYFLTQNKNNKLVDLHDKMTDQLFVICEPWGGIECNPIGHDKWQIAAFGWAEIESQWETEEVKIYRLVHTK